MIRVIEWSRNDLSLCRYKNILGFFGLLYMPAKLPFSPEETMEDQWARWMTEFEIRPQGFSEYDALDLRAMVNDFLEEDQKGSFVDDAEDVVESMKAGEPTLHRLPVMHVTRENLTEVDRMGDIPNGFLNDLSKVTADYVNGFIPGQEINPPTSLKFNEAMDTGRAGSYSFKNDRSNIYATGGDVSKGSPASVVSIHETMHKNNVDALIGDPDLVRRYALIYDGDAPSQFHDIVEETDTPAVNQDLLGGLGLMFLDEVHDLDVLEAFGNPVKPRFDLEEYSNEFNYAVNLLEDAYDLEYFDVRDEAICQAVSFFLEGAFEESFEKRVDQKKSYYNSNADYSHRAGDAIANHLKGIKSRYEEAEGLRGERFKEVMESRIPFLKGEENFSKY